MSLESAKDSIYWDKLKLTELDSVVSPLLPLKTIRREHEKGLRVGSESDVYYRSTYASFFRRTSNVRTHAYAHAYSLPRSSISTDVLAFLYINFVVHRSE